MQVHILYDPSKEELVRRLEKLRPDILMLHGERDCGSDEIGSLVLRDGKTISPEYLGSCLSAKIPELVCIAIAPFILPYLAGSLGRYQYIKSFAAIITFIKVSLP